VDPNLSLVEDEAARATGVGIGYLREPEVWLQVVYAADIGRQAMLLTAPANTPGHT
jgi:hypothetical protein